MKIILLIGASIGIGRYGLMLAKALDKLANVKLIIPDKLVDDPFIADWIEDLDCWIFKHPRNNKLFETLGNVRSIRQSIKSFNPDIMHDTSGSWSFLNILFLSISRSYKFVVTEHEPINRHSEKFIPKKKIYSLIIKKYADYIIVHGPHCLQSMVNFGIDRDRLNIIPHGLYDYYEKISNSTIEREENSILFFGALRPDKGLKKLLKIADSVSTVNPDAKFIVAGKPSTSGSLKKTDWPKKLNALLREMKNSSNFEIHDKFIPDKEVAHYFQRATYVVLPYNSATQSGVATIALAFGCCVVAFDLGDIAYMLQDEKTGFLIPPKDVKKFSETLIYLLDNPGKSRKIGRSAYDYADQELNWDVVAQKHIDLYASKI